VGDAGEVLVAGGVRGEAAEVVNELGGAGFCCGGGMPPAAAKAAAAAANAAVC